MQINADGLKIITDAEGLRLHAYKCPAGVWTIGYGHAGADVASGMVITAARADELLARDIARFERAVAELCPVATPNQFSALVSFAFNLGTDALKHSTLRRMHNEGSCAEAALQFSRWDKAAGKTQPGLTKRRAREAALYAK